MFNISKFLNKFSDKIDSKELEVFKIKETIEKETGLTIEENSIEIKDSIVFIKKSPAFLNKIFISKNKIIEKLYLEYSIKIVDIK